MTGRPSSTARKPGAFQVRVMHALQENGKCRAIDISRLVKGSSSIDQCDRALEGLYRMGFVEDMYDGFMPGYELSDRGRAWLKKEGE